MPHVDKEPTAFEVELTSIQPYFRPQKNQDKGGVVITYLPRIEVDLTYIRRMEDGRVDQGRIRVIDQRLAQESPCPSVTELQALVRDARKEAGLEGVSLLGRKALVEEVKPRGGGRPFLRLSRGDG
jgi:hypothetical protein